MAVAVAVTWPLLQRWTVPWGGLTARRREPRLLWVYETVTAGCLSVAVTPTTSGCSQVRECPGCPVASRLRIRCRRVARHPPGGGKSSGQRRSGRHVRYLARSIERADLSEGRRYGPGGAVEHPVAGTRHARTPALQARGGAAGPRRGPDPVAGPRHPGGGAGSGADPAHRGAAGRRGR